MKRAQLQEAINRIGEPGAADLQAVKTALGGAEAITKLTADLELDVTPKRVARLLALGYRIGQSHKVTAISIYRGGKDHDILCTIRTTQHGTVTVGQSRP